MQGVKFKNFEWYFVNNRKESVMNIKFSKDRKIERLIAR